MAVGPALVDALVGHRPSATPGAATCAPNSRAKRTTVVTPL
ncbi:hypothetical protein [Nocardia beijingensis]|nr:hypothetical protein [Nocardia beijingensis]